MYSSSTVVYAKLLYYNISDHDSSDGQLRTNIFLHKKIWYAYGGVSVIVRILYLVSYHITETIESQTFGKMTRVK